MKTIVGVDLEGKYRPVLELCMELEFSKQEFKFVHAVETIPEYAPPMEPVVYDTHAWLEHLRHAGEMAVQKAESYACSKGIPSRSIVLDGSPVSLLEEEARREGADLIAIGAAKHGLLSRTFFGSVARGLAIGAKQSLIITKSNDQLKPPIRALFASDHSEYGNKCFERLLKFAPQGVEWIDVVTAFEMKEEAKKLLESGSAKVNGDVTEWIEGRLRTQTEDFALTLGRAGYVSRPHVYRGHPNEALPRAMKETGANLLIVGAQGHGFLERMLIGSVSLHQIVAEPYPVFLIRV